MNMGELENVKKNRENTHGGVLILVVSFRVLVLAPQIFNNVYLKSLTILMLNYSILDAWLGPECAFAGE